MDKYTQKEVEDSERIIKNAIGKTIKDITTNSKYAEPTELIIHFTDGTTFEIDVSAWSDPIHLDIS